jgi:hypothetical protein
VHHATVIYHKLLDLVVQLRLVAEHVVTLYVLENSARQVNLPHRMMQRIVDTWTRWQQASDDDILLDLIQKIHFDIVHASHGPPPKGRANGHDRAAVTGQQLVPRPQPPMLSASQPVLKSLSLPPPLTIDIATSPAVPSSTTAAGATTADADTEAHQLDAAAAAAGGSASTATVMDEASSSAVAISSSSAAAAAAASASSLVVFPVVDFLQLFAEAESEIMKLLRDGPFQRWRRTSVFEEFIRLLGPQWPSAQHQSTNGTTTGGGTAGATGTTTTAAGETSLTSTLQSIRASVNLRNVMMLMSVPLANAPTDAATATAAATAGAAGGAVAVDDDRPLAAPSAASHRIAHNGHQPIARRASSSASAKAAAAAAVAAMTITMAAAAGGSARHGSAVALAVTADPTATPQATTVVPENSPFTLRHQQRQQSFQSQWRQQQTQTQPQPKPPGDVEVTASLTMTHADELSMSFAPNDSSRSDSHRHRPLPTPTSVSQPTTGHKGSRGRQHNRDHYTQSSLLIVPPQLQEALDAQDAALQYYTQQARGQLDDSQTDQYDGNSAGPNSNGLDLDSLATAAAIAAMQPPLLDGSGGGSTSASPSPSPSKRQRLRGSRGSISLFQRMQSVVLGASFSANATVAPLNGGLHGGGYGGVGGGSLAEALSGKMLSTSAKAAAWVTLLLQQEQDGQAPGSGGDALFVPGGLGGGVEHSTTGASRIAGSLPTVHSDSREYPYHGGGSSDGTGTPRLVLSPQTSSASINFHVMASRKFQDVSYHRVTPAAAATPTAAAAAGGSPMAAAAKANNNPNNVLRRSHNSNRTMSRHVPHTANDLGIDGAIVEGSSKHVSASLSSSAHMATQPSGAATTAAAVATTTTALAVQHTPPHSRHGPPPSHGPAPMTAANSAMSSSWSGSHLLSTGRSTSSAIANGPPTGSHGLQGGSPWSTGMGLSRWLFGESATAADGSPSGGGGGGGGGGGMRRGHLFATHNERAVGVSG